MVSVGAGGGTAGSHQDTPTPPGVSVSQSSSADEAVEDPAAEGDPVAGPAQLRPLIDGVGHAVALRRRETLQFGEGTPVSWGDGGQSGAQWVGPP